MTNQEREIIQGVIESLVQIKYDTESTREILNDTIDNELDRLRALTAQECIPDMNVYKVNKARQAANKLVDCLKELQKSKINQDIMIRIGNDNTKLSPTFSDKIYITIDASIKL